jgi:hypothetical protein
MPVPEKFREKKVKDKNFSKSNPVRDIAING